MKVVAPKPVKWVDDVIGLEDTDLRRRDVAFHSKCMFGTLTIEVGCYVLVSNMNATNPDSIEGCDVAQILRMYELVGYDRNYNKDPFRATVRWFSRPSALPKSILSDKIVSFDAHEVVEDPRFNPEISIETIYGLCCVHYATFPEEKLPNEYSQIKTRYLVRYKLMKSSGRKWVLQPLEPVPTRTHVSHGKSVKEQTLPANTPKLKLKRTKSIENCTATSIGLEKKIHEDHWKVQLVDCMADLTNALSDVEISKKRKARISHVSQIAKTEKGIANNPKSHLDPSLRVNYDDGNEEKKNYSIVKSKSNTADMKIKIRISDNQTEIDLGTSSNIPRKRVLNGTTPLNNQSSPPKTRKKSASFDHICRKNMVKLVNNQQLVEDDISQIIVDDRFEQRKEYESPKHEGDGTTLTKHIRIGSIKPTDFKSTPRGCVSNDLSIVREKLHVAAIPSSLPCREKEYDILFSFLENKICDGSGGCMYVSGVPGTGKTATTSAVISSLKMLSEAEEIPKFQLVDINGMRLTEPRQAYVQIYRQLTGKTLAWEQAYTLLNKRFTTKGPRRITMVLVIDELDILCNRRQDVVYNLLNWPTLPEAQLIVVTIANTMDLPERVLMGKISSRLGLTRLTFQPYNFRQLQEIVMARLAGTNTFNSDAVQLVSRKVAAVSGDARRALDICRRATELCDSSSSVVSMAKVQIVLAEMITSPQVKTIRSCSRIEQMFLHAVMIELTRIGIDECCFLGVYAQLETLCTFSGISVPNPGRAMMICAKLGAFRLLICENSSSDAYQKILLNVNADDVHYALQKNDDL
ncbi:origin recognition complex subunit 1-like isoform X2 [Anopheles albimanus]|uniref:Origin recognition complex subunit 1 n=1 Tax=Anopheles albimanus TaxID=7167 RepID=A0A182FLN5_ANOAL|nr:origin recognition complex subunit 1-like isoform X2 [Anopheles albimanus]